MADGGKREKRRVGEEDRKHDNLEKVNRSKASEMGGEAMTRGWRSVEDEKGGRGREGEVELDTKNQGICNACATSQLVTGDGILQWNPRVQVRVPEIVATVAFSARCQRLQPAKPSPCSPSSSQHDPAPQGFQPVPVAPQIHPGLPYKKPLGPARSGPSPAGTPPLTTAAV